MNRITSVSIVSVVAVFALAGVFFLLAPALNAEACCGTGNETHSDNDRAQDPPRVVVIPQPVCTLTASKTTVKSGESVTFTWTTQNALSATFTPVGNVAVNGSLTLTFTEPKTYTYTLRAIGLNGVVRNCPATITVLPKEEEPKNPSCDMWVSPSKIKKGEDALLSWESTNASTASIDNGIGGVSVDGSRTVSPSNTTTYTGSFTGYGKTVICKTTVTVEKEPEDDDLSCKLRVSDRTIRKGERVKLSWESEGADYGKINEGIGRVDEEGNEYVYPKEDTTYKATFYGENDEDDTVTCRVKVEVEKDTFIPPPQTPYITLSSVPYTGLDLGPVGTAVYWSFLMLWSVLAAYLVAVKRVHVSLYNFLFGTPEASAQTATQRSSDLLYEDKVPRQARPFAQQSVPSTSGMDPFLASQIYKKS